MKEIGGYFELQLRKGEHYHKGAIQLNTARNCLEYILRAKKYKKIYIPYLDSEVIWEPMGKLGIEYEFYSVDFKLDPIFDKKLEEDEVFFYSDTYGIKCCTVEKLVKRLGKQLIIDNTHAFFSKPYEGIDTIYSPRKFFGLPDGAYLFTDILLDEEFDQDDAIPHMTHLMKRIEYGSASSAYQDYLNYCAGLINQPIKRMSNLGESLLKSLDYENLKERQIKNFRYLHAVLRKENKFEYDDFPADTCPLSYMFYSEDPHLRKRLIENKIYVSTYWKATLDLVEKDSAEYKIVNYLLPLPCDHRYDEEDMERIVNVIRHG
ncbi:hypothetical protein GGR21_000949 [Dysgonomonas hofstadii]|uniref:dTDP-4-amino-4,6-dideoxygalactose transaminase n=1 Tax=Dysgonomonas hofstadii TaxID=637886 RepID=A0A840CGH5_9BACT|nr:hypothetical protein [Dysgonomonas hofstadii]MBB4035060.1 hypothetical protein [Dysgonomonas hofstadii]